MFSWYKLSGYSIKLNGDYVPSAKIRPNVKTIGDNKDEPRSPVEEISTYLKYDSELYKLFISQTKDQIHLFQV